MKLTPHSEDLLRDHLARGGYRTSEEVVERALETLAAKDAVPDPDADIQTSILDLQGLGKAIFLGMDAQEYVERERASWNG